MMSLKNRLATAFLVCFGISVFGQEVTSSSAKWEYNSHELIKITFTCDFKPDSTYKVKWKDFVVISGPSTMNSTSIINGETSTKTSLSYTLKATVPGTFKIESPIFWLNGEKISAEDAELTVIESNLTDEEIAELEKEEFRKKKEKPMGSIRVTFEGDRAYLEEYQFFGWSFKRWLTEEELKLISPLKKEK